MNEPTDNKMKEAQSANRRLAQWRVTWLIAYSTSNQSLWCIDSFVLRSRSLATATTPSRKPSHCAKTTHNLTLFYLQIIQSEYIFPL